MKNLAAPTLLLCLAGCSQATAGAGGPDLPPTLTITSPERGTSASGGPVTVTGRAEDDRGVDHVTVNGTNVSLGADGSFSTTVMLGAGIELIETHAFDSAGQEARDVRAVLVGTVAQSDGQLASPLGARIGVDAFRQISRGVSTIVAGLDLNALALSMNPIMNTTGCNSAKIDIKSLTIGAIAIELVPADGRLTAHVALSDVSVALDSKWKALCIGGGTGFQLHAARALVNGDLTLAVEGGAITSTMADATVQFEGFALNVNGIPGAIEDLFEGWVESSVEKMLASMIKGEVPKRANAMLSGILTKPYTAMVLGKEVRVTAMPGQVAISPQGLFASMDTRLVVMGGEGGMFLKTGATLTATTMSTTQLGLALANDTINQLFAGTWAAGALDQSLTSGPSAALLALLDDDARSITLDPLLPPTVSSKNGALELAIGDLVLSVKDAGGVEIQKIALSLSTSLAAGPNAAGQIALTVGTPVVKAQVLSQTAAVNYPLSDKQVEDLVTGSWGALGGLANDALSNLPLPQMAGLSLGTPSLGSADGFVLADIPIM